MENKLQELTKKLYDEGLEKGRAEADRLVGEAKNEAAKIVAEARAQAEEIVKKARDKAEDVEKNTMTEIALAGKQAAAKIKSEIASMIVAKATAAGVKEAALDPAFIKEMLLAVAGNWNGADAGKVELKALLPEAERTARRGIRQERPGTARRRYRSGLFEGGEERVQGRCQGRRLLHLVLRCRFRRLAGRIPARESIGHAF